MTKNSFKVKFLSWLRTMGMICRKPVPASPRIRIQKTVNVDGTVTQHGTLRSQPLSENNIATARHIWIEAKKAAASNCKFDSVSETCVCGVDIDDFAVTGCIKNRKKQ